MQHGLQSVRSAFGGLNSAFSSVSLPADKAIFILLTVCICACAYTRTCRKRLAARAKAREAEAYTRLGDEEAGRRVSPSKRSAAKASTPPPRFASESGGRTNLDLLLQLLPPPAVPACKNPSEEDEARDEEEVEEMKVAPKPVFYMNNRTATKFGRSWEPIRAKVILASPPPCSTPKSPPRPLPSSQISSERRVAVRAIQLQKLAKAEQPPANRELGNDAWQAFTLASKDVETGYEVDPEAVRRLRAAIQADNDARASQIAASAPSPPPPPTVLPPPAFTTLGLARFTQRSSPDVTEPSDAASEAALVGEPPSTAAGALDALQSLQGMDPLEAMATLDSIQDEAVRALQAEAREALDAEAVLAPPPLPPSSTSAAAKPAAPRRKPRKMATPPKMRGASAIGDDPELPGDSAVHPFAEPSKQTAATEQPPSPPEDKDVGAEPPALRSPPSPPSPAPPPPPILKGALKVGRTAEAAAQKPQAEVGAGAIKKKGKEEKKKKAPPKAKAATDTTAALRASLGKFKPSV